MALSSSPRASCRSRPSAARKADPSAGACPRLPWRASPRRSAGTGMPKRRDPALAHEVVCLQGRRGAPMSEARLLARSPVHRDLPGVVARCGARLVGAFVLFVDHDRPRERNGAKIALRAPITTSTSPSMTRSHSRVSATGEAECRTASRSSYTRAKSRTT